MATLANPVSASHNATPLHTDTHLEFSEDDIPDITEPSSHGRDGQFLLGWDWLMPQDFLPELPFSTFVDPGLEFYDVNTAGASSYARDPTTLAQVGPVSPVHGGPPSPSSIAEANLSQNCDSLASPPENPWPTTLDRLSQQPSSTINTIASSATMDIISEIQSGNFEKIPTMMPESLWGRIAHEVFSPLVRDLGSAQDEPRRSGAVLNRLIDLYFTKFHPAWPVLHRATFHPTRQPPILVLTVLMVGAFMSGRKDLISIAYELYDPLKNHLYGCLTDLCKLRKWSLCTYQALFLNIVFGCLAASRTDAVMADITHGILITLTRRLGFFSDEWVQTECAEETPEIWVTRESKKRLALAVVKLDAYISVAFNRPSKIAFEELNMTVPSTQNTWDAATEMGWKIFKNIDWQHRHSLELSELTDEIMRGKIPATPLVEEDYHLGLCLIQGHVWQCVKRAALKRRREARTRISSTDPHRAEVSKPHDDTVSVLEILQQWRENFALVCGERSASATRAPLKRSIRVCASLIMWHLDIIHLETDIDLIQTLAGSMQLAPGRYKDKLLKVQAWAITRAARLSIWHATEIWRLWMERTEDGNDGSDIISEPIAAIALFQSAVLLWAFASTTVSSDSWARASPSRSGTDDVFELTHSALPNAKLDEWIANGGLVTFRKIPLCCSQRPILMRHFTRLFRASLPPETVGTRLAALLSHLGNSENLNEHYAHEDSEGRHTVP